VQLVGFVPFVKRHQFVHTFEHSAMRVETPQLLWHSETDKNVNAAINGVSLLQSGLLDPTKGLYGNVLATGGNSNLLHLWKIAFAPAASGSTIFQKHSDNQNKIEHLCSFTRPDSAVHAVSFSPDGLHLGAGLSTGTILIWSVPHNKRGNGNGRHFWCGVTREQDLMVRLVRVATDNISDLCWSADSQRLVVGSVDGAMAVCELQEDAWRVVYKNASDHSHYIQGVCYDPTDVYIASMSSDRSVRVFSRKTPKKKKKKVPEITTGKLEMNYRSKEIRRSRNSNGVNKNFFCDEATLNSFVRRLAWTPDGAFLITPAALHGSSGYATLMFARHQYDEPYRILGGLEKVRSFIEVMV
jgi:chromatin assembly factor 1 subunit B